MENRIENTRKPLKTKELFSSSDKYWRHATEALRLYDKGLVSESDSLRKTAVKIALEERS
jgi:hypothetical protein